MLLLVSLKLSKRKLLAKDCHCSSPIPNIVPPLYTWILNRIRNCQVIQSCVFDCRPAARLARMDCGKHFPMQGLANREEFSFPSSFENEEFLQGRTFFWGGVPTPPAGYVLADRLLQKWAKQSEHSGEVYFYYEQILEWRMDVSLFFWNEESLKFVVTNVKVT